MKLFFDSAHPIESLPNLNGWWDVRERGMVGPFDSEEEANQHRHAGMGDPVGRIVRIKTEWCASKEQWIKEVKTELKRLGFLKGKQLDFDGEELYEKYGHRSPEDAANWYKYDVESYNPTEPSQICGYS